MIVEVVASSVTEPPVGTVKVGASLASVIDTVNDLENVFPPSSVDKIVTLYEDLVS